MDRERGEREGGRERRRGQRWGREEVGRQYVKYSREITYSILLSYLIHYAERPYENRKTKAGLANLISILVMVGIREGRGQHYTPKYLICFFVTLAL